MIYLFLGIDNPQKRPFDFKFKLLRINLQHKKSCLDTKLIQHLFALKVKILITPVNEDLP